MLISPEEFTDAIVALLRPHAGSDVLGVYFSAPGVDGAGVTFTIFIDRESYCGGNYGEDQYKQVDLALHMPGRPDPILKVRGSVTEGTLDEAMEDAIKEMCGQITKAFELVGQLRSAGISW